MVSPTGPTEQGQAREPTRRIGGRVLRSLVSADSYGLVLLLLILTYVLTVSVRERWAAPIIVAFQIGTVWLALRTSRARRSLRLVADGLFALAGGIAVLSFFLVGKGESLGALFVASAVLYFFAPFSIIRHVGLRQDVDLETVLGAIAAYLFIGMFFAFAYRSVASFQPGPFFGANGEGTLSEDLFFSFITLSTTGYGNLVPAENPGQTMAVAEAVFGQLFLVTAVAKIISAWKPKGLRAESEGSSARSDEG
jgi:hypothetical protein